MLCVLFLTADHVRCIYTAVGLFLSRELLDFGVLKGGGMCVATFVSSK